MNMLTRGTDSENTIFPSFIIQALAGFEAKAETQEQQLQAKQFLDCLFPLDFGSHQDVTAYLIDYCHLVAYFADGQHCGLQAPKHFIAYSGERDKPSQIVFRDGKGSHVELSLSATQPSGLNQVWIEDIQLESCAELPQTQDHVAVMRHWVSLVKGACGLPLLCSETKEYHGKNREDYILDESFTR